MKRSIFAVIVLALFSACSDGHYLSNLHPENWDISSEEAVFKVLSVTRSDPLVSAASTEQGATRTTITITSDKNIQRSIEIVDAAGNVQEKICENGNVLTSSEFALFVQMAGSISLIDYVPVAETVCSTKKSTFHYNLAYELNNGKRNEVASKTEICPFSPGVTAIIRNAERLADARLPNCTGQVGSPSGNAPVAGEKIIKKLSIEFGGAVSTKSTSRIITITQEPRITVAFKEISNGVTTAESCHESAVLDEKDYAEIASLVTSADLINYRPAAIGSCTPLVGSSGITISYTRSDGKNNAFHTFCELDESIQAIADLMTSVGADLTDECAASVKP